MSKAKTFWIEQDASWLQIPETHIVNVEHPCIIRNVDNGISSLGGNRSINNFLSNERSFPRTLTASLRPHDPVAKPVFSQSVSTQDLLVKIAVPRRTGRKRKRGSEDAWKGPSLMHHDLDKSADGHKTSDPKYLLRSIRDNTSRVQLQGIGTISETHRFRSLPDFQYAAAGDELYKDIRDYLLPMNMRDLQKFNLNAAFASPGKPTGPPAAVEPKNLSYNWNYRQNRNLKFLEPLNPDARPVVVNMQKAAKPILHKVAYDTTSIPESCPAELIPEAMVEPMTQKAITAIRAVLDERPIVSRRVLMNKVPGELEYSLRSAWGYCGYFFTSGPWKDMLVKFGIDPRSDPKYREYQTLKFKFAGLKIGTISDTRDDRWEDGRVLWARSTRGHTRDPNGHVFDGVKLSADGKVWQMLDIVDPVIKEVLNTSNIQTTCDTLLYGWYLNGTMAKIQVIMRDKILMLQKGQLPNDTDYARVLSFPDAIDEENVHEVYLGKRKLGTTNKEAAMAAEVRKIAVEGYYRRQRQVRLEERALRAGKGTGTEMDEDAEGEDAAQERSDEESDNDESESNAEEEEEEEGEE